MHASLQILLEGVVDYAGLFPPAPLPLAESIRNYARYRTEPDAWLLGRFICPASRLRELAPFHDLFLSGPPFGFAAVGRGGNTTHEFLAGLKADLEAIAAFRAEHGERVVVDVYEARLPAEVLPPSPPESAARLMTYAADQIDAHGPPMLTPFYETPLGVDWREAISTTVAALAQARHFNLSTAASRCRPAGFKLRTGGLEAAAFPSTEQVASALIACRDAGVALKFTAGLHHPLRHFDAGLQSTMHGFLNLFTAGVLARSARLEATRVRQILDSEQASDFAFDAAGLHWRDLHASPEEIQAARQYLVTSFGSCSFDEPRDEIAPWR